MTLLIPSKETFIRVQQAISITDQLEKHFGFKTHFKGISAIDPNGKMIYVTFGLILMYEM